MNFKVNHMGQGIKKYDGGKMWYLDGKLHRTDGPAVEYINGNKVWYINGINYSEKEFKIKVAQMELIMGIPKDLFTV